MKAAGSSDRVRYQFRRCGEEGLFLVQGMDARPELSRNLSYVGKGLLVQDQAAVRGFCRGTGGNIVERRSEPPGYDDCIAHPGQVKERIPNVLFQIAYCQVPTHPDAVHEKPFRYPGGIGVRNLAQEKLIADGKGRHLHINLWSRWRARQEYMPATTSSSTTP